MQIKAYVRLQKRSNSYRPSFIGREQGPAQYAAVEAGSWEGVRHVLCTFGVRGYSKCNSKTVCAYARDIGTATHRFEKLTVYEVPVPALCGERWGTPQDPGAPELSSFGNQAVELASSAVRREKALKGGRR